DRIETSIRRQERHMRAKEPRLPIPGAILIKIPYMIYGLRCDGIIIPVGVIIPAPSILTAMPGRHAAWLPSSDPEWRCIVKRLVNEAGLRLVSMAHLADGSHVIARTPQPIGPEILRAHDLPPPDRQIKGLRFGRRQAGHHRSA